MISLLPKWENLCKDPDHIVKFGGKWIVVGSITFRKRTREPIKLHALKLKWEGKQLDQLQGSLYKKFPEKPFLAIEKNLVSDSSWNKIHQVMTLDFTDAQQTIGPHTEFYLVLTVPSSIESIIKQGSFSLLNSGLPESFQNRKDLRLDIAHFMKQQTAAATLS